MITLRQVLEGKDKITELAQLFGFSEDVKIYYIPSDTYGYKLNFIVRKTEKPTLLESHAWLREKLTAELGCEVNITVYERINKLYRQDYDSKSASIADTEAVFNLFEKLALENIKLVNVKDDKEDKVRPRILLEQADAYLEKKLSEQALSASSKGYAMHSFMPSPDKKHQHDSDENTASSLKADEIEEFLSAENKSVAKEALQSLPEPEGVLSNVLSAGFRVLPQIRGRISST